MAEECTRVSEDAACGHEDKGEADMFGGVIDFGWLCILRKKMMV